MLYTLKLDGIEYEIDLDWTEVNDIDYKKVYAYIKHKSSVQQRSFRTVANETFAELYVWKLLGKEDAMLAPLWYMSEERFWDTMDIVNMPTIITPRKNAIDVKCKEESEHFWIGKPKTGGFMACVDHKVGKDHKHYYKLAKIKCDGEDFEIKSPFDKPFDKILHKLGFECLAREEVAYAAWLKYVEDNDEEDFVDTLKCVQRVLYL